ncbi:hypothetical protein [Kribbella shirazensis]|uniref:Uncharacterized protein n=1 Tax=Kribbella shirazensis TaxID=1105143 RepID=A0A7X5VAL9_9ACTN|nr:hypothetical protein [Kribbella shirazensis]NIK57007.1 hypothetical protein [Kribbella shirazensis]
MGYGKQVRTVLDGRQPLGHRYRALRTAVEYYCPLGFVATWAYVTAEAGMQQFDGDGAVRTVVVLETSRVVWLAEIEAFAARRSTEKANGQRRTRKADVAFLNDPRWPGIGAPSRVGLVAAVAAQRKNLVHTPENDVHARLADCADTYINRLGYFRPDERTALLDTITALQAPRRFSLAPLLTYALLADSKE